MKTILTLLSLIPALAFAWQPTKPVTVIFPNAPAAGNEISFRIVASIVERQTDIKFINEHRPGADGNIAMNHFVTVPTDGYTIAVPACQSSWVTSPIWYPTVAKYNATEFEAVANIARSPLAFWAHTGSNINTPRDLVAAIQNKQRPLLFAIGGAGHKLAVEYLTMHLKVPNGDRVETVAYKGPAQALLDVMGGHVEFGVTPVTVGWPYVKAGKLKIIGIANEQPLKGLENVPLMKNVVPGLSIHGCWNLVLPPNTPKEIQSWYREQFVPAIRSAEAAEKFAANMMFISPGEHSPEGVQVSMTRLRQVWQPVAGKITPFD